MAPRGEGEVTNSSRSPGACRDNRLDKGNSNTTQLLLTNFQVDCRKMVFKLCLHLPVR
jgi:hypothetical protein